ncbi:hypothetical protein Dda_7522 [Drechslerella dactyloides]|uniref:ZZ-type domain-containing protein n=1 Tax=Drechslerella dactyloides TaxID=74499 RepID=A0AAD6ITI3_DREDA|nr:hypothetical protein Dda_7522 [Drechslerella dactyloides]
MMFAGMNFFSKDSTDRYQHGETPGNPIEEPAPAVVSQSEAVAAAVANTRFETHAVGPAPATSTSISIAGDAAAAQDRLAINIKEGRVTCTACLCKIDRDKPSFQCLDCVEYEICTDCYLASLSTDEACHHDAVNHRFENIPPLNREERDGRRLHWESFVTADGEVSVVFLKLVDGLWRYLDEFLAPGVRDGMSGEWYYYLYTFGCPVSTLLQDISRMSASDDMKKAMRKEFDDYNDYYNIDVCLDAGPEGNTPHYTKKGFTQSLLITYLAYPERTYDGVLAFLDVFPAAYLRELPPGRPKRAMYPAAAHSRPDWRVYKFPSWWVQTRALMLRPVDEG